MSAKGDEANDKMRKVVAHLQDLGLSLRDHTDALRKAATAPPLSARRRSHLRPIFDHVDHVKAFDNAKAREV